MKLIPTGLTRTIGRQILTMKKNSPRTLFIGGLVGVGVSTVLACRATLKLDQTLDDFKYDIEQVNGLREEQPDSEHRKDMAYVYVKGTYNIAKLYAPALLVGSVSISALTGSHITLTRRNTSLTAAYSAVQLSFDAYRDRVRQELGAEKELDIRHATGVITRTVDGKVEELKTADPNKWSQYARFFDETSANWVKNPELNRLFVQCQQNYLNHLLHARGHVFLNEAYDALGIDRSRAGQVVGWVMGDGDNYIDFGLFEAGNSSFVNGWERSILLDFNVDGVVYDKI